jgi:hypothetical protein
MMIPRDLGSRHCRSFEGRKQKEEVEVEVGAGSEKGLKREGGEEREDPSRGPDPHILTSSDSQI